TKACPKNKGNCDGKVGNGCEVDLQSTVKHCGSCGNACGGQKACIAGACNKFNRNKTFTHTGGVQTWTVPQGVKVVKIKVWGAEGGGAECCNNNVQDDGGKGGYAKGILPVTPGETLRIYVGGEGETGRSNRTAQGGFNGGGDGEEWGAGGGGASDVRQGGSSLKDRVIVAGGGGGGNCGCPDHGEGGAGGGLKGEDGKGFQGYNPGGGGTQNSGGSAGHSCRSGSFGKGGSQSSYHNAGGGGGWYGGGCAYAAGGGGGSSYLDKKLRKTNTKTGVRDGDGKIELIW
ncbi:MAG: glycine-rich protein, partial [Bradymonadaceae bacterium]